VLIANYGHHAKLDNAAKHMSRNIGTAGVVAEVFCKNFFAPVWSRDARLNRYLRNGEPLLAGCLYYLPDRGFVRK
jgi:hypothetical protein